MIEQKHNKIRKLNDSIVYNIGKVYVFLNQYLSNVYAEFDLNPAKFNLLIVIKHIGSREGISQNKLKDRLYVSAANITKLIDALEKRELILRVASKKDRRVNLVKATKKGEKLLDLVWPRHVDALNSILKDYSLEDRGHFNDYIVNFIEEMKNITGNDE